MSTWDDLPNDYPHAVTIVTELHAKIDRLVKANRRLGQWMAAALDDPNVCEEMKKDIRFWFRNGQEQ